MAPFEVVVEIINVLVEHIYVVFLSFCILEKIVLDLQRKFKKDGFVREGSYL